MLLSANPLGTEPLKLDEEFRAIDNALQHAAFRSYFELYQHSKVRISELQNLLLRHQPHIIHFSGHGSPKSEIILQDEAGQIAAVPSDELSRLFKILADNIQCVVLNACYSADQAAGIAQHIDCVAGISDAISGEAALNFTAAFYQALGYGRTVQTAFELGCSQIDLHHLVEGQKPKLLGRADPNMIRFV